MDDSCDAAVLAVLLGFSALNRAQRTLFLRAFNEFMYDSPLKQQRAALEWLRACQESSLPTAHVVAESAAVYFAEIKNKKARKDSKK
jgi:hypothetical protein